MNLFDIVKYMREGAKNTKPCSGAYRRFNGIDTLFDDGSGNVSTCAVGAAIQGLTQKSKLGPGGWSTCQIEIIIGLDHVFVPNQKVQDEYVIVSFETHPTLDHIGADVGDRLVVRRWITLLNDTIRAWDPECDPRLFIADCLEAWASHLQGADA